MTKYQNELICTFVLMEIEEKLDFMLDILSQYESNVNIGEFQTKAETKVNRGEFHSLYKQLETDGYILVSFAQNMFIGITSGGRMFITNGGYQEKFKEKIEQREESKRALALSLEALEIAKQSKRISIKNTNWVIFTAILTLISILLAVLQFCH